MDAPWSARYAHWKDSGRSEWELRGPEFERPYRGVLRPAGLIDTEDLRISDAVALAGPRDVITGWAAARIHGVAYIDGLDRGMSSVPITVLSTSGAQHRPRKGLHPTRRTLHDHEITEVAGVQVATLARAAYDMCLDATSLAEAVVAVDMCTSRVTQGARTTISNVAGVIASHVKTRGIVQARRAVELASHRSASPWESRTRMVAHDAGLRGLRVNQPVFDRTGRLLGIVDLLDAEVGLVIESDGSGHRREDVHADDNLREEDLEQVGLVVSRVTARDHRDLAALRARLRGAHARAVADDRLAWWTIDPPSWWASSRAGRRWQ